METHGIRRDDRQNIHDLRAKHRTLVANLWVIAPYQNTKQELRIVLGIQESASAERFLLDLDHVSFKNLRLVLNEVQALLEERGLHGD